MKYLNGALIAVAAAFALSSCDDDDTGSWYNPAYANALVTVKPVSGGGFYMQLDDSTTLSPVNVDKAPYGDKEVRALISCREVKDGQDNGNGGKYTKTVYVNWIDSVRTKATVPYPEADVDKRYGNDPVEVVNDWVTVAEDGYLTLRLRTQWGAGGKVHYVNLLTGGSKDNPYEVELRHDAQGDKTGHWGDALVAFKLPEFSAADGGKVRLTLKYQSFSGVKTVQFDLKGGKASQTGSETVRGGYSARIK